jgi:hypothetical protein
MLDASAVALLRCAETGRSYWAWTNEEWAGLLGRDQDDFRKAAPGWADDAVRPYLAAHAFLLGGFTAFCQLGRLSRLTRARLVFGRDQVDGEIRRLRSVLAGWGYRLGAEDDTLLPMVACQVFLLNRSPHIDELGTGLFDRIRSERLLPGLRLKRCMRCSEPWLTWASAARQLLAPAAARTGRAAARPNGRDGLTGGIPLPRSLPESAAVSGPRCSRPGAGWRPSIPRPPTRLRGGGRPAPPGSPRWTG